MASWRELAFVLGAALEALAVTAVIHEMGALALTAHLGSCAGIAFGLGRRLPGGVAAARLAFAMSLFLPVFGTLGWLAAARVRPAAGDRAGSALVRTPVPGPEAARVQAAVRIASLASRAVGPAGAVVAAMRGQDDPNAIALLRRSLADPDEDVRLVAHAVLESKLRGAYQALHDSASKLESAAVERRAAIHRRLAAEHWELARLGLAEGDLLVQALERARHHARAALAEDPGAAPLWLLLGRIELHLENPDDAEVGLMRAVERGLPPAVVGPYLAEAAFLERRLDRVRQRLAAEPTGENPALDRIRRFWS